MARSAFRLDGLIYCACEHTDHHGVIDLLKPGSAATTTGNIENANDFKFYPANSAGGIQGYG